MTAELHTLTPLDRKALALLFEGQSGLVELTRDRKRRRREFVPVADVVERMAEFNYFGVAPRVRKGGFKADVVPLVWSVWLDIDHSGGGDLLRGFGDGGLVPTFILHSGRGWWGHWKLTGPVGHDQAEALMRRLISLAGSHIEADDSWSIQQTARLPGSVNEKTGVVARVTEMSGLLYDPNDLDRLLPPDPATPIKAASKPKASTEPARGRIPTPITPAALQVAPAYLREFFCWYCDARLTWEQAHERADPINRNGVEFAIAKELTRLGLSDDDVAGWFDVHRLPRHTEERARRRDYSWTWGLIKKARAEVEAESRTTLSVEPLPSFVDRTSDQPARGYHQVDRAGMIRLVAEHEPTTYTDLWKAIQAANGCTDSTAKAAIKTARNFGYLTTEGKLLRLTPEARRQIEWKPTRSDRFQQGREAIHWAGFTSTQPEGYLHRLAEAEREIDAASADANAATRTPGPEEPDNRKAVAFPSGRDGIRPERPKRDTTTLNPELELRRNWIDHWPRLSFEGRTRNFYIQFVTPLDDLVPALVHDQMFIAYEEGLSVYRTFISRRDPALDGSGGYDPICDRAWCDRRGHPLDHSIKPRPSAFAVALLLEPAPGGFRPITAPEPCTGESVPKIGLVVQALHNFWEPLLETAALQDLTTRVWKVKRGKSREGWSRFSFSDEGPAIAVLIPTGAQIDLDLVLHTLAEEQRIRRYIEPLPPNHCLWGAIQEFH